MANALRNIAAIAGKELRGYFGSPTAWVMMGLFALGFGALLHLYLTAFVAGRHAVAVRSRRRAT